MVRYGIKESAGEEQSRPGNVLVVMLMAVAAADDFVYDFQPC